MAKKKKAEAGNIQTWISTEGTGNFSSGYYSTEEPERNEIAGDMFFRSMQLDLRKLNPETREVEVSFSSETDKVKRWFGTEVLSHRHGAVDLSRLKIGAHLFNHDPSKIIGPIKEAWVEEGRGKAIVGYDETEEGQTAFERTRSKSLRGVSVGYIPLKVKELEIGEEWQGADRVIMRKAEDDPIFIITKWTPLEISSTPIPADPDVGIGRMQRVWQGVEFEKETTIKQEVRKMDKEEIRELMRSVIKEMPIVTPEAVGEMIKKAIADQPAPKRQFSIDADQYTELLARADAIGPQAVNRFNALVVDGRDYAAIQSELLQIATSKPDASLKTGPGANGTGRDANTQSAGAKRLEEMSDEYIISMLTEPTHDLMQ